MPVWVLSESDEGYTVLLGSQPRTDAEKKFIPKNLVQNLVLAPTSNELGYTFGMISLKEPIDGIQ